MNLGIKNKIALVTGGNKNIGKFISNALANEGADLIIAARSASESASDFQKNKVYKFIDIDLMLPDGPNKLIEYLEDNDYWPDIVIHNLGGSLNVRDSFSNVDEWAKVWQFNLGIGHELNCKIIPKMIEKKWGRIVHLSTLSTATYEGNAAYLSAKCALEGYVKRVSKDISKHNVIMNIVAPGLVELEERYLTEKAKKEPEFIESYFDHHLPIRRMCKPSEVGRLVAFMCSEHSAFMPGAIVRIDGGGY